MTGNYLSPANIFSPADIKLSKVEISKMFLSGRFPCNMLGNLGKEVITDLAIPIARDNLPGLVSNSTLNTINKFERKLSGKGAVRAGKGFIYFE